MAKTKLEIEGDGLEAIIAGFTKAVEQGDKLVDTAKAIGEAGATAGRKALQAQEDYNAGLAKTGKELRLLGDIDLLGSLTSDADTKLRSMAKSLVEMGKRLKDVGPEGKAAFGEILKLVVNLEDVLIRGAKLQKQYIDGQAQLASGAGELVRAGLQATEGAIAQNAEQVKKLVADITTSVFEQTIPEEGLPIVQAILTLKEELATLEKEADALSVIADEFEAQRAAVDGNSEAVARLAAGEAELARLREANADAIAQNTARQQEQADALFAVFDAQEQGAEQVAEATNKAWEAEKERLLTSEEVAAAQKVQAEANKAASEAAAILASEEARIAKEREEAAQRAADAERNRIGLIQDVENAIKDLSAQQTKANTEEDLASVNKQLAEAKLNLAELKNVGLPDAAPAAEQVKGLKTRLAEANAEVARLIDQSDGKITPELVEAAEKAAALKGELGDVGAIINALDPDVKLKAIANLAQSIIGGFTAVTGVLNLLGTGEEDAQRITAQMQSLLGVLQGANAFIDSFGKGLKGLNAFVIANTTATASNTTAKAANAAATTATATATTTAAGATGALTAGVRTLTATMAANPIVTAVVVLSAISVAMIALGDDARDSAEGAGELVEKLEQIRSLNEASTTFSKRKEDIEAEIKALERGNDAYAQRQLIEEKYANTSAKLRADILSAFEDEKQLQERIAELNGTTNEDEIKALETYEKELAASQARRFALNKEGQLAELQLTRDVIAFETAESEKAAKEAERLSNEAIKRAQAEAAALLKVREDYTKAIQGLRDRVENETTNAAITSLQLQADEEEKQGRIEVATQLRNEIVAIREQQGQEEIDVLQRDLERKLALIELERTMTTEALRKLSEEQKNAMADALIERGDVTLGAEQLAELEKLRNLVASEAERERTKNKADEVAKRIALEKQELNESIAYLTKFEAYAVAEAESAPGRELDKQKKILGIQIEYAKKRIELLESTGDIADATEAAKLRTQIQGMESDLASLGKFNLGNLLGLSQADVQALGPVIQQSQQAIYDLIAGRIQVEQEANDQYIELLDERLAATQEALDREAGYRDEGEANNYERERAAQEELLRLKENAMKEDERLAKRQAAVQKITQIAQLGSAVAALLASEASKGVIGLGIAAAAIPVLWSLFGAAKKRAVTEASYFKGTPWLELNGNPKGRDTIPINAHEGERIVPTKENERHWNLYEGLRTGNKQQLQQGIEEAVKRFGLDEVAAAFAPKVSMPSIDYELPSRMEREREEVQKMKLEAAFDPALRGMMASLEENTRKMVEDALSRVDRVATNEGYIEFRKDGSKRNVKLKD